MGKENEDNIPNDEEQVETITDQLEDIVEKKEELLQQFEEVKPDEHLEEDLETVSKYGKLKTFGYVFLFGVGVLALIKGFKDNKNDDKSVVQVQRDE